MHVLSKLQFQKSRPIGLQIADQLRGMILSGEVATGAKLPSTKELAQMWQSDVKAVHNALVPLVKEGLLVRHPGVGTFVQKREAKLTCVGIYGVAAGFGGSLYGQAVHAALKAELERAGIEMDVWLDPRPEKELRQPWLPLVKAATQREFQALIILGGDPYMFAWLRKLPVPLAVQGGLADMSYCVVDDRQQIIDLPLESLAQQGCRSVGFIYPANPASATHDGSRSRWIDFAEHFLDRCQELKLRVKDEWIRFSHYADNEPFPPQPQFGYEEFLKLWSHPEKPEGLVVFPDTVAQGVILGLREQHVRVPEDLKLVLHKNESIDLLCPMPATFLVSIEREVAQSLVTQLQKQFRGEPCETIVLPYRLEAHGGRQTNHPETQAGDQS